MDSQIETLRARLNKIKERVTAPSFLANQGIGNEIGFYIFDYPARYELEVREHVEMLFKALSKESKKAKYLHLNLFQIVIDYLKSRGLLDDVINLERSSGTQEVLTSFEDLLAADQICSFLAESTGIKAADCTFVTGIGSCWPFLRAHTVFNNLQNYIGNKPVVLFYPGQYTGQDLKPFGLPSLKANYYRAFSLIDQRSSQ